MVTKKPSGLSHSLIGSSSKPSLVTPSLAQVARGNLCAGCGGCVAVAPQSVKMTEDSAGYLRPVQFGTISASEDARIAAICPGLVQRVEAQGRQDHVLWGPFLEMSQGYSKDVDLRHAGASGGGLSALAAWLIESGTVEAVLHVSADPNRAVGNMATISQSRGQILKAAGSRYAPASPLALLPEIPSELTKLAFIGKPCDAAALRALAAEDPAIASRFPFILSFFCAGTPSHKGAEAVLQALGAPVEEVRSFRYRGNGWPGQATVALGDGSTRSMSYHDSWGKILSKHVQHRCKICADGTGAAADIVCADAWDSDEDGYPLFKEKEGSSLIVARTVLGKSLLSKAVSDGAIDHSPFDVSALAAIQPGQRNRRRALAARLAALRLIGKPVPRYQGLRILAAAKEAKIMFLFRNFLGTLRRGLAN